MVTIKQALSQAGQTLAHHSPSPRLDAEVLLSHALHTTRTALYTHPEQFLADEESRYFQTLVTKRSEGIPIAYLLGEREFWSLPFKLSQDTLIPRPETERLVEVILSFFQEKTDLSLLDLGTGSGAIAIALAHTKRSWQVTATDINQNALDMATTNALALGMTDISFIQSNWFSSIPSLKYDVIVSNPPYIKDNDPHLTEGDVRFEPKRALVSGKEGLDALIHIIQESYEHLHPGGCLFVEHGYDQQQAVMALLTRRGYVNVQGFQDHNQVDRVSIGWRNN